MLRSMYAGISGMKNFQTKLDVVGNNIANVSTTGFKKGRVTFQDMMSQTTAGAQAASGGRGGTNAMQVGLGSQVGTIDNIHTQGFRQTTNNPLDLSLQGDGMFEVMLFDFTDNGNATHVPVTGEIESYYTRAGNFYLDNRGYIVNSEGMYLTGFQINETGEVATVGGEPRAGAIRIPLDAQSFNISTNGMVNYVSASGDNEIAARIAIANFSNPSGLEKEGNNLFRESQSSGDAELRIPEDNGENGTGSQIISNPLEKSNVDLAEEFTEMITAQRGFQANTRIITTSDEILQELVNLKR